MIVYNTLEELQKDIVDNELYITDIVINFNLNMPNLTIYGNGFRSSIEAKNINVRLLYAYFIKAKNIEATSIWANHIQCNQIKYFEISCNYVNGKELPQ